MACANPIPRYEIVAPAPRPRAKVVPLRAPRAWLEVMLNANTEEAARAHLAALLHSPLGVYVAQTAFVRGARAPATRGPDMFEGIWLPIVTPLRDGEVDVEALELLTDKYASDGVAGIVALSTTGEAALLNDVERVTVLQAITQVAAGRVPVIAGLGGSDSRKARIMLMFCPSEDSGSISAS